MRESIGATWIFGIVIVFISLFTAYLAFSLNFTKAFSVKDEIIDTLEKRDGPGEKSSGSCGGNLSTALCDIKSQLNDINYNSSGSCYDVAVSYYGSSFTAAGTGIKKRVMGVGNSNAVTAADSSFDNGSFLYCIFRENQTYTSSSTTISFSAYRVVVFFNIRLDILFMGGNFYVTGETKNITYPKDGYLAA